MVDADDIYVVPNFISEGYFTRTVIPRELELDGALTRRGGRTIKYCEPVGSHPRMTELLLHRAAEIAPGVPPEKTSLFIVGHGTDLNDNSATAAKREVERIAARGLYAEVLNAYMEEAPLIAQWDVLSAQPNVIVVPFFIADGLHSYEDIPVLLGIAQESGGGGERTRQEIFPQQPLPLARADALLRERHRHGTAVRRCHSRSGRGFRCQARAIPASPDAESHASARGVAGRAARRSAKSTSNRPGWRLRALPSRRRGARRSRGIPPRSRSGARGSPTSTRPAKFRPLKTAPNLRHGWRLHLAASRNCAARSIISTRRCWASG